MLTKRFLKNCKILYNHKRTERNTVLKKLIQKFLNKNIHQSGESVGFTLAEVMITLTIIGVVATLTIPALMNKIQNYQFKQAAKVAYSKASQAVQQMRNDNGGTLASYTTYKTFEPKFIKYFNVMQDCNWADCVPYSTTSDIYKTLINLPANTDYMTEGQFITSDGMFWAICNQGGGNYPRITVDVNGYGKEPNIFGIDVFMFQIFNNSLLPMGGANTYLSPVAASCTRTWTNAGGFQGLGCMTNVMQDIDY